MVMPASHYCRLPLSALFLAQFSLVEHTEQYVPKVAAKAINIEEEKELSRHNVAGRVVVIDCVTLWCTNFFMEFDSNVASSLEAVKKEFDKFTQQDATFIFVTNEIGWGGVSENKLQRKFTDLQGWTNQYIASHADDVYLMASGIPVKIK